MRTLSIVSKRIAKVCVISMIGLGMSAFAGSAIELGHQTVHKKSHKLYKCPSGWHLKTGHFRSNQTTVCVPNMPKKMNCPTGTSYVVDANHCMISCQEALH